MSNELKDDILEAVSGGTGDSDVTYWKGYKVTNDIYICPYCLKEQEGLDHSAPPTVIDGVCVEKLCCNFCYEDYVYITR